ncbi:hypothetical protein J5500_00425 [Candidatus Saccharibacteria bacterium]|nr:hypothetical protein [Candidatus Saccharibacteria bacterium]
MSETINTNDEQEKTAGSQWDILTQPTTDAQTETTPDSASATLGAEDTAESQEQAPDPRVDSLAIPLARDYAERNYPKQEDGTFTPCWRGVNGEQEYRNKSPEDLMAEGMSEEEARAAVIDIANTPFDQYSEHWKEANRGGARFLIELVDTYGSSEIMTADFANDKAMRAKYGDLVHKNWMERNSWEKDKRPKLFVPFTELDPAEQQKDIDQLLILQEWLKQQSAGESEA